LLFAVCHSVKSAKVVLKRIKLANKWHTEKIVSFNLHKLITKYGYLKRLQNTSTRYASLLIVLLQGSQHLPCFLGS